MKMLDVYLWIMLWSSYLSKKNHVMVFFNCELYNSVVRSNILFSDFDCLL